MATTTEARLQHATSRDGTAIGYWSTGSGPPLVLVHGGLGDHKRWDALRPHLEPHVTVHALDRRGRGASGEHPEYSIEREYEDVAAVIDDVAADSGSAVSVYGASLGGMCALGSALLTPNIDRLALYEGWPPVPPEATPSEEFIRHMENLLAQGDREAAQVAAYRGLLDMSDKEIEYLKSRPEWSSRLAAAHTIPRDLRTVPEIQFGSQQFAQISVPTLLLVGEESPDWNADSAAAALPDARIVTLEGQAHTADLLAPEVVAKPLLEFLGAPN